MSIFSDIKMKFQQTQQLHEIFKITCISGEIINRGEDTHFPSKFMDNDNTSIN